LSEGSRRRAPGARIPRWVARRRTCSPSRGGASRRRELTLELRAAGEIEDAGSNGHFMSRETLRIRLQSSSISAGAKRGRGGGAVHVALGEASVG